MTKDGLLAFALSVAIPAILAFAGAYLTLRTMDAKKHVRWAWLAFFIAVALLAMGLGIYQQVRITSAQASADNNARSNQERLMEAQKYTQGQLDSITKVLTSAVSSGNGSDNYKSTLRAILSAVPRTPQSIDSKVPPPPSLKTMSNQELKYKTLEQVGMIRDIERRASTMTLPQTDETFEKAYKLEPRRMGTDPRLFPIS